MVTFLHLIILIITTIIPGFIEGYTSTQAQSGRPQVLHLIWKNFLLFAIIIIIYLTITQFNTLGGGGF